MQVTDLDAPQDTIADLAVGDAFVPLNTTPRNGWLLTVAADGATDAEAVNLATGATQAFGPSIPVDFAPDATVSMFPPST